MPSQTEQTASDLVWGCKEIAKAIDRTERQTFYLLEKGLLPAKKVGERWCASREQLRRQLVGEAA